MEGEVTTNNCMIPMLKVVLTESQDDFLKNFADAECDDKCTYVVNNQIFIETDEKFTYLISTFYPIPNEIN